MNQHCHWRISPWFFVCYVATGRNRDVSNNMEYNQQEYQAIEPDFSEGAIPAQEEQTVVPEQQVQEEVAEPAVPEGDENAVPEELPEDPQKAKEAFIKMRQALRSQKKEEVAEPVQEEMPDDDPLLQELLTWRPGAPRPQSQFDMNDPMAQAVTEHVSAAHNEARQARDEVAAMRAEMEKLQAQSEHPELKSDKYFKQRVDEKLTFLTLKAQNEGKLRPTMAQAAAKVKEENSRYLGVNEQAALDTARTNLQTKQEASLTQAPQSTNISPAVDTSTHRARINRGDDNALADALMEGELAGIPDSFFAQF